MAATRQAPPIQIYQDPMPSPSLHPPSKPRPQLQPSAMPLQPLQNGPNHNEPVFAAPYPQMQHLSPHKPYHLSPPQSNYANMAYINIPPPSIQGFTDSPAKKVPLPPHHFRLEPISQQPLFTTFSSAFGSFEQENHQPSSSIHDNADFPEPSYLRKSTLKRSFSDVNPNDRPLKRTRLEEDDTSAILPEPGDMAVIEDDGNKPPYSYAQMIGMAILRAPNRRLTLAQIYEWISTTFAFYREDTKQGWHNSIRHNLSLNKAFNKVERPKGDAGKGCYWVIEQGMEPQFLKDKNRKGNSISNINIHTSVMRPDLSASQPMPELAHSLMPESAPEEVPQTAPALPELSSDATLPASDPALDEEDSAAMPPPYSSPPNAINSSPPVAAHRRAGSSPTVRQSQASSLVRHKRNATTMDDSGYFSSIESSVLRPHNKCTIVLTSELDVEPLRRKKRGGRAEDEIQRIRSSSHDLTPSNHRTRTVNFALDPESSSPIRPSPVSRRNPTTPSVLFKKPMRPPPSVSPNTQLHLHRKAMQEFTQSPIKGVGFGASATSNPVESLPEFLSPLRWTSGQAGQDEFEIFSDPTISMTPATPGYYSSPLKSAKRPGLTRGTTTVTTANVLSEILGNANNRLNAKTPSRLPKTFLKPSPGFIFTGSPLKGQVTTGAGMVGIVDEENDFFDFDNFENVGEGEDSDEGVDLSKGFGKIGAMTGGVSGLVGAGGQKRPALGRSLTSRF